MALLNLSTVEGMITGVRVLLLDKIEPFRYSDHSLLAALNIALNEGRRLRPDIFIARYGVEEPAQYAEISGEQIPVERQFLLAFEYGVAGHALLRDEEDIQDSRANTFLANFERILVGQRAFIPVQGGTPSPHNKQQGGGMGPSDQ